MAAGGYLTRRTCPRDMTNAQVRRKLFLFLCLGTHLSTNYILRPHEWALRYAYTACDDFSDSENPYCSPLTNARVHCAIVTDLYVRPTTPLINFGKERKNRKDARA